MKKTLSFILSLIMVLGVLTSVPVTVSAASVDYLTFELNEDGISYSVVGCDQAAEGEMVIPDTYNELPVTEICQGAFEYCWDITSVIIPDSVTSIAYSSFYECSSLTSVTIGKSASYIAECPFVNCDSIVSIYVNSDNLYYTSVDGVLFNKDMTTLIQYPAGKATTSYVIPEGVENVGCSAFRDSENLTSVTIPDSVTYMYTDSLWGCYGLISINVDSANKNYTSVDGILFNKDKTTILQYPASKTETSYVIPDSVTNIGMCAFYNCDNLTSIIIPDGVTVIDYCAFDYCENLVSITIPNSVTIIDDYAFDWTGYYNNEANWENGVLYIGNHLIEAQDDISGSYEIKNGTKTIADGAFRYCEGLTSIIIPDSVISVGGAAFNGCTSIASISIGAGVKNAGDWIFSGCENLASITIADGVTCIGKDILCDTVYYNNSKNWNNGALYIGNCLIEVDSAFSDSYEIKSGTTAIADRAFDDCWDITSVMIPDSVTNIGNNAFNYWALDTVFYTGSQSKWEDIVVGNENTSLSQATIHYDVNDIETHWKKIEEESSCDCTVYSCPCGYEYSVEGEGSHSLSDGGCTICGKTILTFELNEETKEYSVVSCDESVSGGIIIPDTYNGLPVTAIGSYAFDWCNLTSIIIPNSIISIGNGAFWGCDSLTTITIPDSVTSIGDNALSYCENLVAMNVDSENTYYTSVDDVLFNKEKTKLVQYPNGKDTRNYTIPDSVISIGDYAFHDADFLESVIIPNSVTHIGYYAFFSCDSLTSITIPESVINIHNGAFEYCANLSSITILDSVKTIGSYAFYGTEYYENTENWENSVLYIGNHLIEVQDDISGSYEIKNGTKTIAGLAFCGCDNLTSIVIPNSVISIGEDAFRGCDVLTTITIPDSVTNIGSGSFYACGSLESINVDENNSSYSSEEGVLFNKQKTSLIKFPENKADSTYIIPDNVRNIEGFSFAGCMNITSVVIPHSVTNIGNFAFEVCYSLASITIPDSVTNIGNCAFYSCTTLDNVIIGKGVTSISEATFQDCISLTSITIPESITSIGFEAFWGCNELKNVFYNGSESDWADVLISGDNKALANAIIHYNSTDHIATDWIIDKEATVYKAGSKHKECTECGEVLKTATIPQLKCSQPVLKKVYNANSYVKVTWGTVKGADKYYVYRKTGTGDYEYIGSTTHTYFNDKEAGAGKTCRYRIRAKNEAGYSEYSATLAVKHIDEPTLKSIENSAYGVLVKWDKVTGAEKYNIYRKVSGGEYEYIGATDKTYYTDKTAESGTKYYYAIRGKRDTSISSQSASLSKYYLEAPTLNTPSSSSKGIGLRWSEVKGAEGYKVYRKTADGSYKLLTTEDGVSNVTFRDTTAKKGTKYYYKVKSYKSKTYSAFSNTKSVTAKY